MDVLLLLMLAGPLWLTARHVCLSVWFDRVSTPAFTFPFLAHNRFRGSLVLRTKSSRTFLNLTPSPSTPPPNRGGDGESAAPSHREGCP